MDKEKFLFQHERIRRVNTVGVPTDYITTMDLPLKLFSSEH